MPSVARDKGNPNWLASSAWGILNSQLCCVWSMLCVSVCSGMASAAHSCSDFGRGRCCKRRESTEMMVGFWKKQCKYHAEWTEHPFFHLLYHMPEEWGEFLFCNPRKHTLFSVFSSYICTAKGIDIWGITSKSSPLAIVSHQIFFRPWAAATASQVMLWASFPAFSTTINSKQKPHQILSSCPSFSGPTPEVDFSQATEEVMSSDSLTSLPQPFK